MSESIVVLVTWTTYGAWLPGDARGWRKKGVGHQQPRPYLEAWCRKRMRENGVVLRPCDRRTVEFACKEHCVYRSWHLLAVNVRSNHVHVVVATDTSPQKVRDQLKANCTRALRQQHPPLKSKKIWTKGGDCELLDSDEEVDAAVQYVLEAQDRKDRESGT
jgi:REP element-mobilizing transposase RayT